MSEMPDYSRLMALIFTVSLSIALLFAVRIWLREGGKDKASRTIASQRTTALAIALVMIIGASVYLFYPQRQSYYVNEGYALEIEIWNSSTDLTIDEFWIRSTRRYSSAQVGPGYGNHSILVKHLEKTELESINVTCNRTPVFWGRHSLVLKVFTNSGGTVVLYENGTEVQVRYKESGYWIDPYRLFHFADGGSWVDFSLRFHDLTPR